MTGLMSAKVQSALYRLVEAMTRGHKRVTLLLVDTLLVPVALYMASVLVYSSFMPFAGMARIWPFFLITPILAALLSSAMGIPRIKLKAYESLAILKTAAFTVLLCMLVILTRAILDVPFPMVGIILFGLLYFPLAVGVRVAMLQMLLWVLRLGQPRIRVLIYGAGTTGIQLAAALKSHQSLVPVAFLDDNKGLQQMTVAGLRVFSPDRAEALIRDQDIDRVLLAMPSASPPKQARIARRIQAFGVDVLAVPSFGQLAGTEALVDNLAPLVAGRFLGRKPIDDKLPEGAEVYKDRSVLVTGAGGSIGSELCRQLLQHRPRRIVLFEVSEVALYAIDKELRALPAAERTEIVPILGSVTDSRAARALMADHEVNVVVHAAAYKHVPLVEANPLAGMSNNVLGTRTLADAAEEAGVERFILISTDKAVRPTNVMGASKRLAELVIQDIAKRSHKTIYSMVRFGNVLGSSGSVVPLFNEQIARGGPVTLTHPDVTRYFMTIPEAVRLVLLAGSYSTASAASPGADVFVLDMGKPVRIRDLAEQMIEAAGYTIRDEADPNGDIEIRIIGLRPGEKLTEELLIGEGLLTTPHSKILRAREASLSELDMAKALQALRNAIAVGDGDGARAVARNYVEGYGPEAPPHQAEAAPGA